jgi:hypothetical protein
MPGINPGGPVGTLSSPYLSGGIYPTVGGMNSQGQGLGGLGYFPPYYNPWMMGQLSPSASYLFGAASITQANSQYYLTIQQARLQAAYANQAQIDVRRRLFDQYAYERAYFMANLAPDVVRERDMVVALNRSRKDPPLTEVLSGDALNSLLNHLITEQGKGNRGPRVDLTEDSLKNINVSNGVGGNIGLLKDGGKLQWPLALQQEELAPAEKILDQLLPQAVQEVKFGNPLQVGMVKDIKAALQLLNDKVNEMAKGNMSSSQFVEARRYLNQLNMAFKGLTDPNAVKFFDKAWSAKGATVAELVKYLADNGLRFAPATQGDEAAYRALLTALQSYDNGISGSR